MHKEPDRDRAVESLLRQLKQRAGSAPSGACLEADTIAAWADGGLTADELAAAEQHLADCSRCQALLVATIRSGPAAAVAEPWWRRRWALGVLVPMTAAAAALTLWIAVPQDAQRRSFEQAPPLAKADVPSQPAAPAPSQPAVPAPSQPAAPAFSRSAAAAPSQPAAAAPPREERQVPAERAPAPAVAEGTLQKRADDSRNKLKQEQNADVARERERRSVAAPRAADAVAPPQFAPPLASAPASGAANAVQPFRDAASTLTAKAALTEVESPDRSSRWRPGRAGVVEYSSDSGSTWQTLSTGVSADLTAGGSPSPSVCWLVGRGGTVLLSTDGRNWQRVAFPEAVDLITVSATDARTATVTTADGRRFGTRDAGLTWRRI